MERELYELISKCLRDELQIWETANYPVRQLVRTALFSLSERMAEEFKRINPEFDREKFVKAFSQ